MGRLTYIFCATVVVSSIYCYIKIINFEYAYLEVEYTVDQLVESHKLPFENHSVTTRDGYILQLHRIPSASPPLSPRKPPIFILHGLIESSILFLIAGEDSLPIILAKKGYDVWLGNSRGNAFSRKHVSINPDTNPKDFFDFSWHEIGAIDLPTMIDYVLARTNSDKLYYVGHSQGSVTFYVMMSEQPEYNNKVELMFALAPVVHTKEIKSWAFNIPAMFQDIVEWSSEALGFYELLGRNNFWTFFGSVLCKDGTWTQQFCDIPLGLSCGFNKPGLNTTLLSLIYAHFPAGSSIKQLLHYTQILKSDIFRQYDHGKEQNLQKYGQATPPLYHLNRTTVPVALLWAENDWLTSERDVNVLYKQLPNVILFYKVPEKLFTHFDFLVSYSAKQYVYSILIKLMEGNMEEKLHAKKVG